MTQNNNPIHIKVIDAFNTCIKEIMSSVPELKSVGVIFDWHIGREDLPFGIMAEKSGPIKTSDILFSLMEQTAKFSRKQSEVMVDMLADADARAMELSKILKSLKSDIEALEIEKSNLIKERNSYDQK